MPRFLPLPLRLAVRLGGLFAPVLPWLVVPIARIALRRMVDHLVIDATPVPTRPGDRPDPVTRRAAEPQPARRGGARRKEADRRLAGTLGAIERPDVDYVSIKVSAAVAPHAVWAFDAAVDDVVGRLTPLYEAARRTGTFINLDMEEYKDLDLTIAVFQRILDAPALPRLPGRHRAAGVPPRRPLGDDAAAGMERRPAGSRRRRDQGPAREGRNLPMERVEAAIHDWPLATWHEKIESDTNYKRVLDWALTPERTDAVQLGVAGHNLFDVAHAWLLAGRARRHRRVEFEMLLGMATGQAEAVRRDVGGLLVYTPVVHPRSSTSRSPTSSAGSRRARATTTSCPACSTSPRASACSSASATGSPPRSPRSTTEVPPRTASRAAPRRSPPDAPFRNAVDTDPAVPAHRAWANELLERAAHSQEGVRTLAEHTVTDERELDAVLAATRAAGRAWGARPSPSASRSCSAPGTPSRPRADASSR